jgi:xanthine dehydrogenase YagS FAD-binding subunit
MQRTRCYYFYDLATPCNKREPGSGCSAIGGYNRIHAILGASEQCIATHPSDMCVALAALAATVRVSGPNGERTIAFADFHRLPGDSPHLDNTLAPGELITGLDLPAKGFEKHFSYLKLRDRTSYAFALVSVAAALELEGNIIKEARLALGGVAHKPWRDTAAEDLLKGQPATADTFRRAAARVVEGARGYGHNTFKIELAKRAIVRALKQATDMSQNPDANAFQNSNP